MGALLSKYTGVVVGVFTVVIIVCYLLYRLVKTMDVFGEPLQTISSEAEPSCQHRVCGQYCTLTVENNDARSGTPHNYSEPTTNIENLNFYSNYANRNNEYNPALDLPPSYISAISDSSQQLNSVMYQLTFVNQFGHPPPPPPYSEAILSESCNNLHNLK